MALQNNLLAWLTVLTLFVAVNGEKRSTLLEQKGKQNIQINIDIRTPTAIVFSVRPSSGAHPDIRHYLIRYSSDGGASWSHTVRVAASEPSFTLNNLLPYTKYTVEVLYSVYSGKHFTKWPVGVVEVWTTQDVPGPPEDVLIQLINSTSVFIRWKKPRKANGPVLGYNVEFLDKTSRKTFVVGPNVSELLVKGVNRSANLRARVAVFNSVGRTTSNEVVLTTEGLIDEHVELPQLPFAVPTRPAGFVYKGGKTSAPLHLDVFLDLTCADSRDLWPTVKELAESFGPDRLRVTVHFFALAYFNNAFISLQSVYIVAAYNSSLLFPWVDMVFENRDYLINSKTTKMNRLDIAEIMEELGSKNNIPSDVMKKGLTDWPLEWQARLAWKYACSKGVSSTPTVFMNGVFVAGDVSAKWTEEQWKGLINKMLS